MEENGWRRMGGGGWMKDNGWMQEDGWSRDGWIEEGRIDGMDGKEMGR